MRGVLFVCLMLIALNKIQAEGLTCDFNNLTQDCTAFSPDKGPKINLPDGTFIPNFSILRSADSRNTAQIQQALTQDTQDNMYQNLQFQVKAMKIFDQLPSSEFSDEFKIYLANRIASLRNVMLGKRKDFTLPWPPASPTGMKSVSSSEVERLFLGKLNPSQKEQLTAIARDFDSKEQKRDEDREVRHLDDASELRRQMLAVTDERKKKVLDLIEFSRKTIIEKIKMGRSMDQLTEHEKKMVEKVQSINVIPAESPYLRSNSTCTGLIPNAFYDPGNHSINICPNFYNYPDTTILGVLGHELGHSIDPCNCQFGHHRVDRNKIDALMSQSETRNNNERFKALDLLQSVTRASSSTSFPFPFELNTDQVEFLSSSGVLTRQSQDTPFDRYPLMDVYSCLISPEGGGFRTVSRSEIEEFAAYVSQNRAQIRSSQYNPEEDRAAIVQAFIAHPECTTPGRPGQTGEAVSDWLGAEVLGEYLKGKKFTTNEERLAPIAFFASMVCLSRVEQERPAGNQSIGAIIGRAMQDAQISRGPHPASQQRVEQIFLRNPQIRAAIGCGGGGAGTKCEHRPQAQASGSQETLTRGKGDTRGTR